MSVGRGQCLAGMFHARLLFRRRKLRKFPFAQAHAISRARHANGPHTGIETGLNIGHGVSHFHHHRRRKDVEPLHGLKNEPGRWASRWHLRGRQAAIGRVALFSRLLLAKRHSFLKIASGSADFAPHMA